MIDASWMGRMLEEEVALPRFGSVFESGRFTCHVCYWLTHPTRTPPACPRLRLSTGTGCPRHLQLSISLSTP